MDGVGTGNLYEPNQWQTGIRKSRELSQAVETAAQAAGDPMVLLLGGRVLFHGPRAKRYTF